VANASKYIAAVIDNARQCFKGECCLEPGELIVKHSKAIQASMEVAKAEHADLTRKVKELQEYVAKADIENEKHLDDLRILLYAFDHPDVSALGSKPFKRLRAELAWK
jgi:hypothetical protein